MKTSINTDTRLIIGPPGTGKTSRLLNIMEEEFKAGCTPDRMVFCSFTKKAVDEAVSRATERFNFTNKDMIYFRTIHSLAFNSLGLKRNQVMQSKNYTEIGEHLGLSFSSKSVEISDISLGKLKGDQYLFIDGFSRARCINPKLVWDMVNHDNLNWYEFLRFRDTLNQYKEAKNLIDFSDMLEQSNFELDVDVVIIDEAQDLSTAQWDFISRISKRAKRIYIGGDDDQAIFGWAGADVNRFMNTKAKKEVLHQSYRVPKAVHKVANSITSKIKHREIKNYKPMNKLGSVEYWNNIDHIDLTSGTWLLLARNSYLLTELVRSMRTRGVVYALRGSSTIGQKHIRAIQQWEKWRKGKTLDENDTLLCEEFLARGIKEWPNTIWHEAFVRMPLEDREYYISLLRRGESLTKNPRININTIHGVKGGEADHVVLLSDMATSTWEASNTDPDSEHRVWYVGATRCKESLNIIMPRGRYAYNI